MSPLRLSRTSGLAILPAHAGANDARAVATSALLKIRSISHCSNRILQGALTGLATHDGAGFLVTAPAEATFQQFLNVTDELLASFPDLPYREGIAQGLDAVQNYASGVIYQAACHVSSASDWTVIAFAIPANDNEVACQWEAG